MEEYRGLGYDDGDIRGEWPYIAKTPPVGDEVSTLEKHSSKRLETYIISKLGAVMLGDSDITGDWS